MDYLKEGNYMSPRIKSQNWENPKIKKTMDDHITQAISLSQDKQV